MEFSGIASNPTYAKVQEGAALVRQQQVDFIFGAGGGSVIDCLKRFPPSRAGGRSAGAGICERKIPGSRNPLGAVVTVSVRVRR